MPAQPFAQHFTEHQKVIDACIASLQPASDAAAAAIISCFARGGKMLAFGNGGSATQASHFVEELIGRFKETRRPLPAISLVADAGVVTCIANDFGYGALFEKQGLEGGDADHVVAVPSEEGAYIQEVHLMLIHVWCIAIDATVKAGGL